MKKIIFLLLLITSSSCVVTQNLWKSRYYDSLTQYLLTEDASQVIFIGKRYHYIVNDNSGRIVNMLLSQERNGLYIDINRTFLEVDSGDNISGYITVKSISEILPAYTHNYLISLGFVDNGRDNLYLQMPLRGRRYEPIENLNFRASPLNKRYDIRIKTTSRSVDKLGKVFITPFTLIVDVIIFPFVHNW